MDETEVQVEIACWAQDHPESWTINWKHGNEPWVGFSGKRRTLHVGLGGLTWSIELPSGYQTQVDPGDGKRKRLWDPLDDRDMVIVQSKCTPFNVSVVDHSNNIIDLTTGLEQEFADKVNLLVVGAGSRAKTEEQTVHDMLKSLQVESLARGSAISESISNESRKSLIISNSCFGSLKVAETLSEVLDALHGLAKLYNKHIFAIDPTDAECQDLGDDDDDVFATEIAIKWSYIAVQVNHAQDACAYAAAHSLLPRMFSAESSTESGLRDPSTVLKEKEIWPGMLRGLPMSSPSGSQDRALAPDELHNVKLQDLTIDSPPGSSVAGRSDSIPAPGILARLPISSPSGLQDRPLAPAEPHDVKLEDLTIASPPGSEAGRSDSIDTDEEYTFVFPRAASGSPSISEDSSAVDIPRCDYIDSDNSDSSWEIDMFSDPEADESKPQDTMKSDGKLWSKSRETLKSDGKLQSGSRLKGKRKFQQVFSHVYSAPVLAEQPPDVSTLSLTGEPITKRPSPEYREVSDDGLQSSSKKIEESGWNSKEGQYSKEIEESGPWISKEFQFKEIDEYGCRTSKELQFSKEIDESGLNIKELQYCDIAFNPMSFSVECTIHLREFMDNPVAATALGFDLDHPLRVEIVPNKSHVDSLAWNGAVEVYVSQQSDWHNHVSEEICGLLCLVPSILHTYFHNAVPALMRNRTLLRNDTRGPKGDLFIRVLQTLVRRLSQFNANAGGSCCVCGKPCDRPSLFYMQRRTLWHCSDSLCEATYATWEKVSSVDAQEHEREEKVLLRVLEESLRNEYPFSDKKALKAAVDVYGVQTVNLNYGELISALAKIELWNQKDN